MKFFDKEVIVFELLFEDPHLLIVNKPAGLLTQPDSTGRPSMEKELKTWLKKRDHKPGNVFLEATHRIDRPVSGIVVFAKRSKALSRMQAFIREGKLTKRYTAITEGVPQAPKQTLEHYLVHDDFRARIVREGTQRAKLARLTYQVVKKWRGRALLEIELHTGRYHQIRIQLASIGCPIVGDGKYGSVHPAQTIQLHHSRLTFPHPTTLEWISVESPPQWKESF